MTHVSATELRELFLRKHGSLESCSAAPRRRFRFGYHMPSEYYEALVNKLVTPQTAWIDVGGGGAIFPDNPRLARELAQRARRLVGVDPSDNITGNSLVHEAAQCLIEDFQTQEKFDLATMRKVVEHVTNPAAVVSALNRLLNPGGHVVVFTVNRWSPVTLVSHIIPFQWHYPIKRVFWGGQEEDTFPTVYKMNTRKTLKSLFEQAGFREDYFAYLDDVSVTHHFAALNYVELSTHWILKSVGLKYPENCLLGMYTKSS